MSVPFVACDLLVLVAFSGEVNGAVNVLNDDDGLARGLHEELSQLGVVLDRHELEVVDVVVEEVGHGGDHGGLASVRWSIMEVPHIHVLPTLA